jgi:hypothetical protein
MKRFNKLAETDPRLADYTCLDASGKRVWGHPETIRQITAKKKEEE